MTQDLGKIEHIVWVMMENRSFDHYFGALNFFGRDDIEGLGKGPLPVNRRAEAAPGEPGPGVPIWCMDHERLDFADPPHEWREVRQQVNGGALDGFVSTYQRFHDARWAEQHATVTGGGALTNVHPTKPDYGQMARVVMGYYTGETLPVLWSLADQFAVCDHWFSSFLGSTHPNRIFAQGGDCGDVFTTSLKSLHRYKPAPVWEAWEKRKGRPKGITWKTYFHPNDVSMFALWLGFANAHGDRAASLKAFEKDCEAGTLPQVAIVEPPYTIADDHPSHDPRRGQQFLGFVVRSVLRGKSWPRTAIIITYDEHGGFFDHVKPEVPPEGARPVPRDLLGLRVPSVVISPYTPARLAVKDVLDHTSVLRTIQERWDLPSPASAGPRLEVTRSLWSGCFDLGGKPRAAGGITLKSTGADWRAEVSATGELKSGSDFAGTLLDMRRAGMMSEMRDFL